jgi:hypothetical protein
MGTSSRHPGSNDRSPLVPAHADAEPGSPLPEPPPQRFKQFRRNMGDYVKSGDKKFLQKGLSDYAGKATGGVGHRRFGTAVATGGAILGILSALGTGNDLADTIEQSFDYEDGRVAKINEAVGQPIDHAIQILSDALAPSGEESDKIREAIVCALSESLQGEQETFDLESLSEEVYTQTIINFLAEIIFIDIYNESGEAFEKAETEGTLDQREEELRETIIIAVDNHLASHLENELSSLSLEDIKRIQLSALKDVFSEWENLE